MRADLHIHTYYSDGLQSPEDVARTAKENGVELISITDHDTALSYPEIFGYAEKYGVKVAYGIEISAYYKGVRLHTLGYGVSPEHPVFKEYLKGLVKGSLNRMEDILSKLEKNGIHVPVEEVMKHRKSENAPVHGMYISRAGAKMGYSSDPFAFQKKYITYGGVAYSEVSRPTPEEAVEVITSCGGIASLAHPGRIELERGEIASLVDRLVGLGLGGIEAVYSGHNNEETEYYTEMARRYGLYITGGSDTHFAGSSRRIGTPIFDCDSELCERLLNF